MKTFNPLRTLLLLAAMLSVFGLKAQWLTTGNNINFGEFLGTTNAQSLVIKTADPTSPHPIVFYTSNVRRMMIF